MSEISNASSEREREKNIANNLMHTLELIWEDSITLKVINNVISMMMRNSMIARDLRLKRIYAKFREIINTALLNLTVKEMDHDTCTWEVFKENLKNQELSMLLETLSFTDEDEIAFINAYVSATKDIFLSTIEKINNIHVSTIQQNVPKSQPTIDKKPDDREMLISTLEKGTNVLESKATMGEEPDYQDEFDEVMIIEAESNTELKSMNIIEVEEYLNSNGCENEEEPEAGTSTDQNITLESTPVKRQCRIEIGNKQTESKGREIRNEVKKIAYWMSQISTAPINHIFDTMQWHDGPYRKMQSSLPVLKAAIAVRQAELSIKGLLEIFLELRINEPLNLLFACPLDNIHHYYYNIAESIAVLEKFLYLQYVTGHKVSAFLDRLVEILDKRNPHINAMFISGDSKSGKSFFFNCVIHALLNYGIIDDFRVENEFPLQDCIKKRVLLWNNPSAIGKAEATLKLLFRGEKFSAGINTESYAVIERTPIIMLGNRKMFNKNESLERHIYYEEWKRCTYLSRLSKQPYPLAVYYLLIKWKKIIVDKNIVEFDAEELRYIE